MLLLGILWGLFTGHTREVSSGILEGAADGVSLSITMLGMLSMWSGFLQIAQSSGLLKHLSAAMRPLLHYLFPELPGNHPVQDYLSMNILSNIFGLGGAATPAGLQAMEEMRQLHRGPSDTASRSMCTFLILNVSSLQLFPMNILAYRKQYHSVYPESILLPAIVATAVSTLAGIIFDRVAASFRKEESS